MSTWRQRCSVPAVALRPSTVWKRCPQKSWPTCKKLAPLKDAALCILILGAWFIEKESEVQRQSMVHLSHVHGSHNKQNTSLMNGHRCFYMHRSRIFHFRHRCWHCLIVCAVVPQVERENFSTTSRAHCRRPNSIALEHIAPPWISKLDAFFAKLVTSFWEDIKWFLGALDQRLSEKARGYAVDGPESWTAEHTPAPRT